MVIAEKEAALDSARIVWPRTFWPRFSAKGDSLAKPV